MLGALTSLEAAMATKTIYHGGLMRCCLQTLAEYTGTEEIGTKIGCKFHKDPNEPVMIVTWRGWEWIGASQVFSQEKMAKNPGSCIK